MPDIIEKLNDLHRQATAERSHNYVAATSKEAATVISTQRMALERIRGMLVGHHDATATHLMRVAEEGLMAGR